MSKVFVVPQLATFLPSTAVTRTTMGGKTSDQAKLFFFGLLRTVSALASTDHKVFPYAASLQTSVAASAAGCVQRRSVVEPDYTLRLARRSDVASIQRCNLSTLPENYNQQFYFNHLRQWPELALVVECNDPNGVVSSAPSPTDDQNHRPFLLTPDDESGYAAPFSAATTTTREPNGAAYSSEATTKREPNIVAYVIGKVEEHVIEKESDDAVHWGSRTTSKYLPSPPPQYRTEKLGHVTSLAVLESYRRKGLAQELMHQLHYHMALQYGVESVGLHVRQSNQPAERLYRAFGYQVDERIPQYYQDGEDAFLMKKRLQQTSSSSLLRQTTKSLFFTLRRSTKPWENGPTTLRLPRSVGPPPPEQTTTARRSEEEGQGAAPDELLSGTM